MTFTTRIGIVLFAILFVTVQLFGEDIHGYDDGSVLLPAQKTSFSAGMKNSLSDDFQLKLNTFTKENGQWSVFMNPVSGTPHRAFGKAIKIREYDYIDQFNIENAAMSFVEDNAGFLGVDPQNLRLKRISEANGRWYVTYIQTYQGVDVLLTEVELRIFSNGNVTAFGSDYYNNINIDTYPSINSISAQKSAVEGLNYKPNKDKIQASDKLFILPVITGNSADFRLVYKYGIKTSGPSSRYSAYVDANNGELLWRHSFSSHVATNINVKGSVKLNSPADTLEIVDFPNYKVRIDGSNYFTDDDGHLEADFDEAAVINIGFEGRWIKINKEDGVNSKLVDTINSGGDLEIVWDDSNSHRYERIQYYHGNIVHDFINDLDPNFTGMDYQVTITILNNDPYGMGANAFWDGSSITFLKTGDQSTLMADGPSVLYHEYGHGINQTFYQQHGAEDGLVNASCNEALADVTSAALLDRPEVGLGVFANNPGRVIRNIDNNNVYPEDISGESHQDGLILGGAFWDLRKTTSLEFMQYISHYARYGLPDDPDVGIAFSEWFLETLIADDDDGDLSNGTPNAMEIIDAFNKHQIGTNLFIAGTFSHDPLEDTQDTENPYQVEFTLSGLALDGSKPQSVRVVYSTDNFNSEIEIDALEVENGIYIAEIPAQSNGTQIHYYISAVDPITSMDIEMAGETMSEFEPYDFLVGFYRNIFDDFENESGWTVGHVDDNANQGQWELGDPNEIDFTPYGSAVVIQTGTDHSEEGHLCFVTGAGGNIQNYQQHMPNGITTLTSPVFDLSSMNTPALRFYYWMFYAQIVQGGNNNWGLNIYISNDAGDTWEMVENIKGSTGDWTKKQFLLSQYFDTPGQVMIRFEANVRDLGPIPSAFLEVLIDDFEILSIDPVSVEEENPDNKFELNVYPNPFTENSRISLNLEKASLVTAGVYNELGSIVSSLTSTEMAAGYNEIEWDGMDLAGVEASPGIYLIKINIDGQIISRKLIKY